MAKADVIAARALELAYSRLEQETAEILEMAEGDPDVLYRAADVLQTRSPLRAPEHIAFSLVTAAFDTLRPKARRPAPQRIRRWRPDPPT
jgi:hypothetical protein